MGNLFLKIALTYGEKGRETPIYMQERTKKLKPPDIRLPASLPTTNNPRPGSLLSRLGDHQGRLIKKANDAWTRSRNRSLPFSSPFGDSRFISSRALGWEGGGCTLYCTYRIYGIMWNHDRLQIILVLSVVVLLCVISAFRIRNQPSVYDRSTAAVDWALHSPTIQWTFDFLLISLTWSLFSRSPPILMAIESLTRSTCKEAVAHITPY